MFEIKRAQPLLGTFVEITANSSSKINLALAVDAAFTRISSLQALLSRFDPQSDVSRLNTHAHLAAVHVSSETYSVLSFSEKMHKFSDGAFDIVAPYSLQSKTGGSANEVQLLSDNRVVFLQPLKIDLGGIAKGFAVDCAIETLRQHGVESALVNAGGDLRAYGKMSRKIWVRSPGLDSEKVSLCTLSFGAIATSATYFLDRSPNDMGIANVTNGEFWNEQQSISVLAQTCMVADALTKVVATVEKSKAAKVLAALEAQAILMQVEDGNYDISQIPSRSDNPRADCLTAR